jgi:hypothetical protein
VQQLAGRRVIDVLFDRDQLGARHPQLEHEVGVVAAVAGETVELIYDHIMDVALLADALQHGLQARPVGGLGAFAAVEVFLHDLGAELLSLAVAGLALSG